MKLLMSFIGQLLLKHQSWQQQPVNAEAVIGYQRLLRIWKIFKARNEVVG